MTNGGDPQDSSLAKVFIGETVTFASGRYTTVRPWSAKALVRDIPAIFGRLFQRLAPLKEGGESGDISRLPVLLELAMGDGVKLLTLATDGLTENEIEEELTAADLILLVRAVVRQNDSFFDQVSGLISDLREKGLVGQGLQQLLSSPGSGTPN